MAVIVEAHLLWVYGPLSRIEQLCLTSFVANGYRVYLWTYGSIYNVPEGVVVCDGREILPESAVFLDRAGGYVAFSDVFRYAVLHRRGGLWADTDVVALKPASALPTTPFLVTERNEDGTWKLNNNVIYNPRPSAGNFIDMARVITERYPREHVYWGTIGSVLLTGISGFYQGHGFAYMASDFANPIDFWTCPQALLTARELPDSHFVHLYNEMWRRAGVDKQAPFPERSLMADLARRYSAGDRMETAGPG